MHNRTRRFATIALPTAVAAPAWAQQAAAEAPAAPSFVTELLAIVIPLALIIVGLLVVLRLLRKRYGLTGQDAPLSILQILPVGPRERLVLVKARSGRVFTIGVASQGVNFVTDLDPEDVPAAAPAPSTAGSDTADGR